MKPATALATLALLPCLGLAGNSVAGQSSGHFQVGVIVIGPSLPVAQHPHLANARIVHLDENALFQVLDGSPEQARAALLLQLPGWQWQLDELSGDKTRWQALGHSPQGQCMRVQARAVLGQPMVRLRTERCGQR